MTDIQSSVQLNQIITSATCLNTTANSAESTFCNDSEIIDESSEEPYFVEFDGDNKGE